MTENQMKKLDKLVLHTVENADWGMNTALTTKAVAQRVAQKDGMLRDMQHVNMGDEHIIKESLTRLSDKRLIRFWLVVGENDSLEVAWAALHFDGFFTPA